MEVMKKQDHFLVYIMNVSYTFKSLNSLKVHLSSLHTKAGDQQSSVDVPVKFCCLSCGFSETCSETD